MKATVLTIAVSAFCCLTSTVGRSAEPVSAQGFLHRWAASFSEGNADAIVAFYEDSKDVLAIQSTGQVRKGTAEIRREYEAAIDEVEFEQVTLENLTVRQSGDVAWASCEFRANTLRHFDQTRWTLRIYTSFVLKRAGTTWKIVMEQSTPIAGVPRVKQRAESGEEPTGPN